MPPSRTAPPALPAAEPVGRLALALSRLAETQGPIVHVAATAQRARALTQAARALRPGVEVAHLPAWDCFPYDRQPPSTASMGVRMGVLRWLTDADAAPPLLVTTAPALLHRVPPRAIWTHAHAAISVGDPLDPDALAATLARLGYRLEERVDEPGEAALRPHVVDLFPAAAFLPCRVEHADGRVVAIRSYDPVTQAGEVETQTLVIDPASEIVRAPGEEAPPLPLGAEHRLSERYERLETLFDYLPRARLVLEPDAANLARDALRDVGEAFAAARAQRAAEGAGRAPLPPEALHLSVAEWERVLAERLLAEIPDEDAGEAPRFVLEAAPRAAFSRFVAARRKAGDRVVLAADGATLPRFLTRARAALGESATRIGSLDEAAAAKRGSLLALEAPLEAGFAEDGLTVVAAADLMGELVAARPRAAALAEAAILPAIGDAVVHAEHGVARLEGLERVEAGDGQVREAVRLVYADGGTLLVPVDELDRVWRHGGSGDRVRLDRLDTDSWSRRRGAVEAAVAEAARGLARLAAERDTARAPAIRASPRALARFADRFPHPLTEDQATAIAETLADLARETPMDRLVCGDVGFGKTEVALRAAAAAALAGKQVAVLAPTTVLARQHAETFAARFAGFGVRVAQLSRLVPAARAREAKAGIADGSVRIAVGTHALAGKDVRFADLGLLVIDEEQRFGARQKSALKRLRDGVHVLTLTATPIPATLAGGLIGLRAVSTIATPPVARKPIRTALADWDDGLVREALTRERARGGRSFVVTPRIADLDEIHARLARLVPGLRVAVAHGEMKPAAIDEAMLDFARGEDPPDVLLATNIVESGLDVPRADTMIVVHPDRFGLSQLHQLRGRVGRGRRQAACWLLTEPGDDISEETRARLVALTEEDRLGAGFALSLRDLDLRGAGELLGEAQAGHAEAIGIGLYADLFRRAMAQADGGDVPPQITPRIEIGLYGTIPEDVVGAPELRLELYGRLARIEDEEALESLEAEIEDRFGAPSEAVRDLLALASLRLRCRDAGILRLEGGPAALAARFREEDARALQRRGSLGAPLAWKDDRLVYARETTDARERLTLAQALLDAVEAARRAKAA